MSEPNPARFYMVFNPAANPPTYMHPSRQGAIDEAKRLAAKCPGKRFFVLEACEAYQVDLPEPRRIELGGNALRVEGTYKVEADERSSLHRIISNAAKAFEADDVPF
ncbi:hypothetical protein G6K96_21720 [Agrobacterium vitis]|uniref:hypothetical protein n=1 Tax=Agrobacterium vitis TaxID=373 RepID=UPI0015724973|nr:hypothetical protein [Agrobacterium vitis]NTA34354.1 hypothetical protein [Agrobacterium vitis]